MNLKKMILSWDATQKAAGVMLVSNVLLAAGLLMAINKLSDQHERIVLTPPGLSKQVSVGWLDADTEYLKSFGLYFATLMTNVTPKSAPLVADSLSSMVAPAIYPDVRKQILAFGKDPAFLASGGSVSFEASEIVAEKGTNKVFIVGERTVNTVGSRERTQQVLELTLKMAAGRPQVQAIDYYPGNQPHTAEWLAQNKGRLEAEQAASAAQKD
jgi:conjugal transfer pilus assembly protein TraE